MSFDPVVAVTLTDGTHVDITEDVTGRGDGFRIVRGQANESTRVAASSCEFELNNASGIYSPRNPLSPYYQLLTRNSEVRVCTRELTDDFGRTVANGWGSTSAGAAWSLGGSGGTVANSDWQVTPGAATHSIPAANAFRRSYLATEEYRDVEVFATAVLSVTPTGAPIDVANIILRGNSDPLYYQVRAFVEEDVLFIGLGFGGTSTSVIAEETFVATYVPGESLSVRAQVEGQTLRARAWLTAEGEHGSWDIEAHDDTLTSGYVGILSGLAAGNTNTLPVVVSYSDYQIRVPRFSGELSNLPPRWDTTGNAAWVPVEAGGILRRLSRNDAPLYSAPRREYLWQTNDIDDDEFGGIDNYWPCEDTAGVDITGRGPAIVLKSATTNPGGSRFAQGVLAPWLPSVISVQPGDVFESNGIGLQKLGDWSFEYSRTGGPASAEQFTLYDQIGRDTWQIWAVKCDGTAAGTVTLYLADVPHVIDALYLYDGQPHHIRFDYIPDGSLITADRVLYIDGVEVYRETGAYESMSFTGFQVVGQGFENINSAVGHIMLCSVDYRPEAALDPEHAYRALLGWKGETAGERIQRLCAENVDETGLFGIGFEYIGDLSETTVMGPQRVMSFMSVIQECVDADRGILYEPRGLVGLGYRTRLSLMNQAATLALDYGNGHLAPPWEPTDDDQLTVNDVLIKRVDGGEYRATQTTGMLAVDTIGRYRREETLNVAEDNQLPSIATWILHLGTVDEARYPRIGFNRARPIVVADVSLSRSAVQIDMGDRLTVSNVDELNIFDALTQLVFGYEERVDQYQHVFVYNCVPERPFQTVVLDSPTEGRLASEMSELVCDVSASATMLPVDVGGVYVAGENRHSWHQSLWTSTDLPFSIVINGEEMLVTAVSSGVSFVGAGAAVHGLNSSLTPPLPAGIEPGDLLCLFAAIRNSSGSIDVGNDPDNIWTGWLFEPGHIIMWYRYYTGVEPAPLVVFSDGTATSDTSAQCAAFRGVSIYPLGGSSVTNVLAQNIGVAAEPDFDYEATDFLVLYHAWKQDDWTSIATVAGGSLIGASTSTAGDDQGIAWNYEIVNGTVPTNAWPAKTFVVTGGAVANSRAYMSLRVPRIQRFTVTRGVNGVTRAHAAGSAVRLARPATLAL